MAIYIEGILDATRAGIAKRLLWRDRMLKSKTAIQLVTDQHGTQAKETSGADSIQPDHAPKRRGNLAATLDPILEPRLPAGQPGRPKGVSNYQWTPEADGLLIELCTRWGAATAKRVMGRKIQESRVVRTAPRPDSVRKAVEYRMAKLGISMGQKRRKTDMRKAKSWSQSETTALLGALGADATIESIAARTGHSVKSVRAKIARLDYEVHEIHGFTVFTVDTLAARLHVTPRQIRRWKERGWLETQDRRITEAGLGRFLRTHPDRIPFDSLPRENQVFLVDLGFPSPDAAIFKKNVREILDGIGRQRKPRRKVRRDEVTAMDARQDEQDDDGEEGPTHTLQASSGNRP
jgi:cob(I)alamin adenosyltransferase